jgi:hypothetical protein
MSTKIMALVWPLQMPLLAKSVYISLADNSNDHGICWPSIATISERVCATDRAVQKAILWLEQNGALTREMSTGRSTKYLLTPEQYSPPNDVHPRTTFTTPPNVVHPTPEPRSPHPRTTFTLTVIEPSKNRKGTVNITPDNLLAEVSEKIAHDFIALRKAKKAPVTETALAGIKREAEKAGYSLERALQTCCERGWVGFKAEWVDKNVPMVDKNDAKTRNLEAKRMLGFLDEVIDV